MYVNIVFMRATEGEHDCAWGREAVWEGRGEKERE